MKALLAALIAAGAPFVGETNAAELARNLVTPIVDPEEGVIDEALDARVVPRVGGWLLDEAKVDVDGAALRIDPTLETTTRTGHLVKTTRMPRSAAALFETRVTTGGKEVCFWDCNSEREAAEQHAELVAKYGGAPIEAPDGLISAEYIKLALDCLDQAGLSRWALQSVASEIRSALDNDSKTCRLVGDGLDEARIEVEAFCARLARAS